MAKSLAAFLAHLVLSDERLNSFLHATAAEKKEAMRKYGLTPSQYNAVMSGDLVKILKKLNDENGPKPGDFMGPPW